MGNIPIFTPQVNPVGDIPSPNASPESFGAKGYRVETAADLVPTLKKAFEDNTVVLIDCQVDYSENMKLTERLKQLKSPL